MNWAVAGGQNEAIVYMPTSERCKKYPRPHYRKFARVTCSAPFTITYPKPVDADPATLHYCPDDLEKP